MERVILFGCGSALGSFVGAMVGMSASPVVATVVSALVGIVTAYCTATLGGGLQEALKATSDGNRPPPIALHIYLAGFSLFGIVALFAGLYIRTHNILSPTPKQIVTEWREAGLSPSQAQQVALNLYDVNRSRTGTDANPNTKSSLTDSVLIAGDISKCDEILGYINRERWELAEKAFEQAGDGWTEKFAQLRHKPIEVRHKEMSTFANDSCSREAGTP